MEFNEIITFLEKIQPLTSWSAQDFNILKKPYKISTAMLSVDGKEYPAFRILYNNARGPGKGGIRFHMEVDEDEVKALSFWMAIKTTTVNIPYGGAKGGVRVNPKELSIKQIQNLSREYIRAFYKVIGPHKDIPAPDVYTTPQIMAWMMDEYETLTGAHAPGIITGKPIEIGGTKVRGIATALGGMFILDAAIEKLELLEKSIIIQGFGNAGKTMAQLLYKKKYNIVGVSDSKGAIYNKKGLNIDEVIAIKESKGSVDEYTNATKLSNEELLTQDCTILIPAALAGQITNKNAANIKATIVLELANGPTTHQADALLHTRGVHVIPDILANAGGVATSYYEWAQNISGNYLEDEVVEAKLRKKMLCSFEDIWELYQSNKHDMRTTAYIRAIDKILTAEKLRGRI